MPHNHKPRIAIIGAGFSGTLTAIQCCKQLETSMPKFKDYSVLLIEQNSRFALGAAYRTSKIEHLLNVPAWNMSAFPDDKNHFLYWLAQNNYSFDKTALVPRQIYGKYLQSLLRDAQTQYADRLQLIQNKIIAIQPQTDNEANFYELECEDGQKLVAKQVLLALGNFPPQNPPLNEKYFFNTSKHYWKNPWQIDHNPIPQDATCLIIGTGLTMVDKVLELEAAGHTGKITALSRHGLLPFAHSPASLNPITDPWTDAELKDATESPRKLFHWLREQTKQNSDWRVPILKLRPSIQRIWKNWPITEKKRFLRHCRAWWDVRRHMIDDTVSRRLSDLQASGQLKIIAGRLENMEEKAEGILCKYRDRHSKKNQELNCNWVINCIGPDDGITNNQDPLIKQLRDSHQIQTDGLGLGLNIDEQNHVLNTEGQPQGNLFAMGPLLKGVLWESLAVPELRQQAVTIAINMTEFIEQAESP